MADASWREAILSDRRNVAIHEAGHAVAAWRLDLLNDEARISINPGTDDDWGGIVRIDNPLARHEFDLRYGADTPPESENWSLEELAAFEADSQRRQAKYRQEAEDLVVVTLAGYVAGRIATLGVEPADSTPDYHEAMRVLERLTDAYPGDDEVLRNGLWAWLDVRAEQLLRRFWPAVEALADALLVRGEIAGADVLQIMREAWKSSCSAARRP